MTRRSNNETYALEIHCRKMKLNPTFIWTMRRKWKANHLLAFGVFSMLSVLGGPRWLTSYRMFTRGSGLMRCDDMLTLYGLDLFITQPWLCDGMLYEIFVFDVNQSSYVKLRCLYKTLDPTIFGVIDQLHLDCFSSRLDGIEVWNYYWWCHVLTWPFWESSISIVLRHFLVICWGPKCFVNYLRCFLVACGEPLDL